MESWLARHPEWEIHCVYRKIISSEVSHFKQWRHIMLVRKSPFKLKRSAAGKS